MVRLVVVVALVASLAMCVFGQSCVCYTCQKAMANKMISMNGDFLEVDQIVRIEDDASTMYLNGETLENIGKYLKAQQQKYMKTDQINNVTAVTNQITSILDNNATITAQLIGLTTNVSLNFIMGDQAQVDKLIADLKANNTATDVIKQEMCKLIFKLYTPEKRIELSKQLLQHIKPEHREQIMKVLSQVFKIDDIPLNDVPPAPAGMELF